MEDIDRVPEVKVGEVAQVEERLVDILLLVGDLVEEEVFQNAKESVKRLFIAVLVH